MARRYRKKGLDKTALVMVEFLKSRGIEGATVLEIGGGVGEIQIELLKQGADHAVNLELSPAYDGEAALLLREANLRERVERLLHDIAADPDAVESVDIVVLHRVVCCYPDYERLLRTAAAHAQRLLVFSYPPRNSFSRLFVHGQNLVFRVLGREFRAFVHPPAKMLAAVEKQGFRQTLAHRALIWQVAGLER
jgi:magnesium-protoporphyrin O-methyltransferase